MLDVIVKTRFKKIDESFDATNIMAGIIYDGNGEPCDKIMFTNYKGYAKNVFTDEVYYLEECIDDECFVSDVTSLSFPIRYFFHKRQLNLAEMLLAYKRFLNDERFLNKNLNVFGMTLMEVGYKSKLEVFEDPLIKSNNNQKIYRDLIKIINYKNASKNFELDNEQKGK